MKPPTTLQAPAPSPHVVERSSSYIEDALDWLFERVRREIVDAHVSADGRRVLSREQRRAEIVHRLLAGAPVDGAELVELGYELDAWHLAVIAMGAGAEKAVRGLATKLGRQLLSVAHGSEAAYAWLGGHVS